MARGTPRAKNLKGSFMIDKKMLLFDLDGTLLNTIDDLATVSGATMTTGAYKDAIKDALNTATILGGGSADIRTEEEILADNLKEALPSGESKFTKWFVTESLTDVSDVYVAENGVVMRFLLRKLLFPLDFRFFNHREFHCFFVILLSTFRIFHRDDYISGSFCTQNVLRFDRVELHYFLDIQRFHLVFEADNL